MLFECVYGWLCLMMVVFMLFDDVWFVYVGFECVVVMVVCLCEFCDG